MAQRPLGGRTHDDTTHAADRKGRATPSWFRTSRPWRPQTNGKAYHALLSPASIASLKVQGGPMDETETAAFAAHPMAADAVALRRWDDAAKDPEGPVLEVTELVAAYERYATRGTGVS
ncbi:hypothetical protein [Streptomyces sp. NPDC001975]